MRIAKQMFATVLGMLFLTSSALAEQTLDCRITQTSYGRNGKILTIKTLKQGSAIAARTGAKASVNLDLNAPSSSASVSVDIASLSPGAAPLANVSGTLRLPKSGIRSESHSAYDTTADSAHDFQLTVNFRKTDYTLDCSLQ